MPDDGLISAANRPPIPNSTFGAKTFDYFGLSCYTDPTFAAPQLYFNNPRDLTVPARRYGSAQLVTLTNPPAFTISNDPTQPANIQSVMAGALSLADAGTPVYPMLKDLTIVDQAGKINLTATPQMTGADVLLTDVLSMDTKILVAGAIDFIDLYDQSLADFSFFGNDASGNPTDFRNPAFAGANGPRVFDTWTKVADNVFDYSNPPTILKNPAAVAGKALNQTAPIPTIPLWNMPVMNTAKIPTNINFAQIPMYQIQNPSNPNFGQTISIKAIQVTLRIWDPRTKQTRQVTIVQDL